MEEVLNYLKKLLKKDDVIVFGCSGGPDSMALLDLLLKVRIEKEIKIVVAHINHNVRKESAKEMVNLENYCNKHDVIFEKMTITKYSDDNFHNEARTIRYNFFENLITKYNGQYLMTAHHGDDLMETILMRLVRGSTLNGYAGFNKEIDKDGYKIVRPLITVTKKELEEYDKKNKISFAVDKSNFKDKYTRNRYRKYVLPFLKNEDPNVHQKFLKYSNTLFMYDDYINKQMKSIFKKVYNNNILDIEKFKKLDLIIQNKVIYYLFEKYYEDDLILISDVHTNLVRNLIYSTKSSGYIYLPNNIKVIKSYNDLKLVEETKEIDSYEIELGNYAHLPNGKNIESIESSEINDNNYCRLNSKDIVLPLHVRTRKSGDKMFIKGMEKDKKLKEIFINSKIPIEERDLWPVVVDSKDNIVWIPGLKKSKYDVKKQETCDILLKYY